MMFVDTEDALQRHLTTEQAKFVRGLGQTFEKLSYQALRQKRFNLAMMMATKRFHRGTGSLKQNRKI